MIKAFENSSSFPTAPELDKWVDKETGRARCSVSVPFPVHQPFNANN
jgi:hypothetical protein